MKSVHKGSRRFLYEHVYISFFDPRVIMPGPFLDSFQYFGQQGTLFICDSFDMNLVSLTERVLIHHIRTSQALYYRQHGS